jgi:hypothetical protein
VINEHSIVDRLIEAFATGQECRVRYEPRRFYPAISPAGLGLLTRHKLWREAVERILQLDTVHPDAQFRFLDNWMRVGWMTRQLIDDDELFFPFLRKVLPLYHGGELTLYRGQLDGQRLEPSWSRVPYVALKFALVGDANLDPLRLALRGVPKGRRARINAVVLRAAVPAADIICAPCLLGQAEGEYVIDPRGIIFSSEPAAEAAVWIRKQAVTLSRRID